jgi:hypothetical protein
VLARLIGDAPASSRQCILFLGTNWAILCKVTLVHFDNKRTKKKISATTFVRPIFFSYMEHPLKP